MLLEVAKQLDAWISVQNIAAVSEGLPLLKPCRIRVMGQVALLESGLPLTLAATADVDVKADYEFAIESQFRRLLEYAGKELDPLGHEIWMPRETNYRTLFCGQFVTLQLADPDAILVSKAARAPTKNRALLVEYLARGASPRFFELCNKYSVDLERLL
jgi:hypothetical protein